MTWGGNSAVQYIFKFRKKLPANNWILTKAFKPNHVLPGLRSLILFKSFYLVLKKKGMENMEMVLVSAGNNVHPGLWEGRCAGPGAKWGRRPRRSSRAWWGLKNSSSRASAVQWEAGACWPGAGCVMRPPEVAAAGRHWCQLRLVCDLSARWRRGRVSCSHAGDWSLRHHDIIKFIMSACTLVYMGGSSRHHTIWHLQSYYDTSKKWHWHRHYAPIGLSPIAKRLTFEGWNLIEVFPPWPGDNQWLVSYRSSRFPKFSVLNLPAS